MQLLVGAGGEPVCDERGVMLLANGARESTSTPSRSNSTASQRFMQPMIAQVRAEAADDVAGGDRPWARTVAPRIASAFYHHRFAFSLARIAGLGDLQGAEARQRAVHQEDLDGDVGLHVRL